MADVPANQRLWNMLVTQAKAKFAKWPSLPASKWVHKEYVQRGGRFLNSEELKRAHEAAKRHKKVAKKEKDDK